VVSVSVIVTSKDKRYGASDFIDIPFKEPNIVFYELNPLLGISKTAFPTESTSSEKEFSFFAIPFYYKTQRMSENLSFSWRVNGQNVQNRNVNDITLRNDSGKGGIVEVSLAIDSLIDKFQTSRKRILIEITK